MPRPPRTTIGGICYHVLNRGNGRIRVFRKEADYEAFVRLIADACERLSMPVLAYCLMPNHFHLVLQPHGEDELSVWMQWLTTSHVRRYHSHHGGSGHVWQGRFKSFPIQSDEHLYTVLRYVERNPLRANLVERSQDWAWSSLRWWGKSKRPAFLQTGPVERQRDWVAVVNRPQSDEETEALCMCIARGTPFGSERWQTRIAEQLGIESTLRPRGRPRQSGKK